MERIRLLRLAIYHSRRIRRVHGVHNCGEWTMATYNVRAWADWAGKFIWGPMSFIVAWMITSKHPLRYPLQIVVTMGQLYGLELYYATSLFDHFVNQTTAWRPEAYYFWVYFFFMNFIWVVFPGSESPIQFRHEEKLKCSASLAYQQHQRDCEGLCCTESTVQWKEEQWKI